MPIPKAPEIPLAELRHHWEEAQRVRQRTFLERWSAGFVRAHELDGENADRVVQCLPEFVEACVAAMGLDGAVPSVPGLNEIEFGLLRAEELFCRFLERMGKDGATMAGLISGREIMTEEFEGEPFLRPFSSNVDFGGVPEWLVKVAVLLKSNGPGVEGGLRPPQPVSMHISWTKWLLLSEAELVALGVPKGHVAELRFDATGHDRPMRLKWARSIGMWGRVRTVKEIAEATGATPAEVKSYKAKADGTRSTGKSPLQTKDSNGARSQVALARELGGSSPEEQQRKCGELGILRVEARLYDDLWNRVALRLPEGLSGRAELDEAKMIAGCANFAVALPPERWGTLSEDEEV